MEFRRMTVPFTVSSGADDRVVFRPTSEGLGFNSAHLVGIGGCGMSALAWALLACGVDVSGSDVKESSTVRRLREAGARITIGHSAEAIERPEVAILSSAIRPDNPEVLEARRKHVRMIHRSDALALFLRLRRSILVSGTHGKTTTTAMLSLAMEAAGLDPWGFVGGNVPAWDGNSRVGGVEWAVAEADESDGTFERLPAQHLIVTNVEDDHLDYWKTSEAMRAGYRRVVEKVSVGGTVLVCADDPGARDLAYAVTRRVKTYSLEEGFGDYSAGSIVLGPFHSDFHFFCGRQPMLRVRVGVPGRQNISNAVATLGMVHAIGGDIESAAASLADFHGVGRRFEQKGIADGVTVIDDYAHHPTEIAVTIHAALAARREMGGRLVVVFQPHRYTRTRDLMDSFATCFDGADMLVLAGIYGAGEDVIEGITTSALAQGVERAMGRAPRVFENRREIAQCLVGDLRPGDLVLTLGAGDNWQTAEELVTLLKERETGRAGFAVDDQVGGRV
jgi:UDP-N-acetylmuramate--alanine ligase